MEDLNVNVLSLVLATLTPTIVGTLFYSKLLFGKAWMNSIGMTDEQRKKANMPLIMGLSLIMSLLLSFFMLSFCNDIGQEGQFDNFGHGAWHGGFVAIVVVLPTFVLNALFEQKSWKNVLINVLYWFITLILMGGILDAMNHWPNA